MDWNIVIGIISIIVMVIGIIIDAISRIKKNSKGSDISVTNSINGKKNNIVNRVDINGEVNTN